MMDKKNIKRPEPGRPISIITEKNTTKEVDPDYIANKVIDAIINKIPSINNTDNSNSQESIKKIAEYMAENNQAQNNLNGLGKVEEIKKDNKEVNKSIDILSQLGD